MRTSKVWPQHQSAVTLLGGLLAAPDAVNIDWLDLACGKGQIIGQLEQNIPDADFRARIAYHAFDIDNEHNRIAEKLAHDLGFRAIDVRVGEMEHFPTIFPVDRRFGFISFTNTVHEIRPKLIGGLIVELIRRLTQNGVLYVYDMETLPVAELGAVPWEGNDVKKLLATIVGALGGNPLQFFVQRWENASCIGWSINLQRQHLNIPDQVISDRAGAAANAAEGVIYDILRSKLDMTARALEALTRFGSHGGEEGRSADKLLNDYWSLRRALGQTV